MPGIIKEYKNWYVYKIFTEIFVLLNLLSGLSETVNIKMIYLLFLLPRFAAPQSGSNYAPYRSGGGLSVGKGWSEEPPPLTGHCTGALKITIFIGKRKLLR